MAEHTLTEGWRDRARKAASICAGAPPHTQSLGRYVLALLDERDDLAARLARVEALADLYEAAGQAHTPRSTWATLAAELRHALAPVEPATEEADHG